MRDPFWEDAINHYFSLTTDEERKECLRIHGPEVAGCLLIMLDWRIQQSLREIEQHLTE